MKKKKNVHVVPHDGKWGTRTEGNKNVTKKFETQKEAIDSGRTTAKKNESELKIHKKNGRIRDANSYGNDPRNIKG